MEEATVTLYRVAKCGFYADENKEFGDLSLTMEQFRDWTQTLGSVGESSTYTPSEDDDFLRAFCIDIRELASEGAWIVVTWNELARVEEGVQVVEADSRIGRANVSAVEIDAMSLPGYPAYFYVDSEQGLVLNLRFDQRLNGSRQFQKFLQGFLATSSEWCFWDADDDGLLVGYGDDDAVVDGVEPKFSTSLMRRAGSENFFIQNCERIRKIIRRASVNPIVEDHKVFLDSAFKLLGLPVNNRLKAEIAFQYEFKTRLTEDKLNRIIATHNEHVGDAWDDVGFVFARESSKVHWLSGSIARDKIQVDVDRLENGMMDVDSLAAFLNANAGQIIERLHENR